MVSFLLSCGAENAEYTNFSDFPGFREYYAGKCTGDGEIQQTSDHDKELLFRFRPRLVIPPGNRYPVEFYEEYLPFTSLCRYTDGEVIADTVTPEMLRMHQHDKTVYLDLKWEEFQEAGLGRTVTENDSTDNRSVVYGRVYRERVEFLCGDVKTCERDLIFLKYNVVFPISGLPADLPPLYEPLLGFARLDTEDWHELDNFVAVHVVLNEMEEPVAALLAQHNHHRTYMIGKDISLPSDGRLPVDVAVRSNEVYPSSESSKQVKHRAVRWGINMKYLLSGEDAPLARGNDITYGIRSGGKEIDTDLKILSPCDPFYTATIMLGEPRRLFGKNIGRDGGPGADYYAIPELLTLGTLLQFSYLHDGDEEDIRVVDQAIDVKKRTIDIERIVNHGGKKFFRELITLEDDS